MIEKKKIKTRFAPSPTGYLHIGGARTALFNWLFAKHSGGIFVLRIEDTDQARSTEESYKAILDSMKWLGLDWDEGPFLQSARFDIYLQNAKRLVAESRAYYCDCMPEELEEKRKRAVSEGRNPVYDGTCRKKNLTAGKNTVIRFKSSSQNTIRLNDLIKGLIDFEKTEQDDFIILRSDGYPTYNFAAVVDDSLMGITHVIRGDDHVNNTPRQISLYDALGYNKPAFAHVPMILGEDRSRLSKRHGAVSVTSYRDMGYLPEAMINYLVRLGWSHGDQEIFSREELIEYFTLDAAGKSSAVFNPEKLLWLNYHYIKQSENEQLLERVKPFWRNLGIELKDKGLALSVIEDLKARSKTLVELSDAGYFYFVDDVQYDTEAACNFLTGNMAHYLSAIADEFSLLVEYSKEAIDGFLRNFVLKHNIKLKLISQPLRVALTGRTAAPGLDQIMHTLGKDKVIKRLKNAVKYISEIQSR